MLTNPQFPADFVTFAEEILNWKPRRLGSEYQIFHFYLPYLMNK